MSLGPFIYWRQEVVGSQTLVGRVVRGKVSPRWGVPNHLGWGPPGFHFFQGIGPKQVASCPRGWAEN